MQTYNIYKMFIRTIAFVLILGVGTLVAMAFDETEGLARSETVSLPAETVHAAGGRLFASGDELYRSTDNGQTWDKVADGPAIEQLISHPTDPAILYAGGRRAPVTTVGGNLWQSRDGGESWTRFNLNLPLNSKGELPAITALAVDPAQPDWLYVGTDGQGLYRFDAGRLGYRQLGGQTLSEAHIEQVMVGREGRLYVWSDRGLFVEEGDEWQPVALPEGAVTLMGVVRQAETLDTREMLYLGSVSTGVYRSEDGGETWQAANEGVTVIPGAALRVTHLAADAHNPRRLAMATVYGVGSRFAPGHVYESTNGGTSWEAMSVLDSPAGGLTINEGIVHVATDNGLHQYGAAYVASALSDPSGVQWLILALSLLVGLLALLIPVKWLRRWQSRRGERVG